MKMKQFATILLTLAACILATSFNAGAQTPASGFSSGEGAFWIGINEKPTSRSRANHQLGKFDLDGESVVWQGENGAFDSLDHFYVRRQKPNLTLIEKRVILEDYKKATIDQFKELNIATSEVPYQFSGTKGVEIRGVAARKVVSRIFFLGSRLIVVSSVRNTSNFDEQTILLNSFRALTEDEHNAALVRENMPEPFAIAERDPKWTNDLKDKKISGKVNRVLTTYQKTPRSTRLPSSEERFDRNGDLVSELEYSDGVPSGFLVYGWLDGMRVTRREYSNFRLGERGPNQKQMTMIVGVIMGSEEETKPADPRFGSRLLRTYDDKGNLTSTRSIDSRGREFDRRDIAWNNGRKIEIGRDENGELISKTIFIFNDKGHVSEERMCDEAEKDCESWLYKYEFDATGNWIVQRRSFKETIRGRASIRPSGVYYRTIEYAN